ncbi:17077_t:CDS:1 [Acaulospora morrowiae]|uniref:histone acetyltransferase n=1 Tax=Acaulospora morrowiae TaxID=94023 RepID=A0A9N9CSX6_9GLOM|nr:17077_t:CDS:1 [Acaulospora morrowiae]
MSPKVSTPPSSRPGTPNHANGQSLDLTIGCKLFVEVKLGKQEDKLQEFRKAEILSIRTNPVGQTEYYVHFLEFNKRLDEWVKVDRFDLARDIERPIKKKIGKGSIRDTDTPPRVGSPSTVGQKRKHAALEDTPIPTTPSHEQQNDEYESVDGSATPGNVTPLGPLNTMFTEEQEIERLRTSGSMTQILSEISRVKNLERIHFGPYDVETWYFSPYPQEYSEVGEVHICEFCLYHFICEKQLRRHSKKCQIRHPPGNEIYRCGDISFFEIDGNKQKTYCRNLCLLSKLFLDHKTLRFDVDPFLFYIMCQTDNYGCHLIGYFSKEKESTEGYNLACILTLPQHQRKGFGRLLIAFSYELSKKEGKVGSPEKPLSDLGWVSYRSYWSEVIVQILLEARNNNDEITIEDISGKTSIKQDDVISTLNYLNALKPYKGQTIICLSEGVINAYHKSKAKHQNRKIDESCLQWTPPHFTSNQLRFI